MKTSEIPSWFWETDQAPRDEILHIGPELEEQRWVSNGHVMLRVDPAENGDTPIVQAPKPGAQAPLKYVHLMLIATMTELVSEASTRGRGAGSAYLIDGMEGDSPADFAGEIGNRSCAIRYVTLVKSLRPGTVDWAQDDNGPAIARDFGSLSPVAIVQALDADTRSKKPKKA